MSTDEVNQYILEKIMKGCWHEGLSIAQGLCDRCGETVRFNKNTCYDFDYCSDDSPRILLLEVVRLLSETMDEALIDALDEILLENSEHRWTCSVDYLTVTNEQLARACVKAHQGNDGITTNRLTKYRKSGIFDINGVEILEGSVINADGYKSRIEDNSFHCVFYDNGFYSDIYGDADPITSYKTIEVVGHAEDYRELYNSGEWSGNLGEGLK